MIVNCVTRTNLFNSAVGNDGNSVRHDQCFLLVMSDDNESDSQAFLKSLEFDLQTLAQLQVQRRHGLVQQQDLWLVDNSASERDALLLSARKLRRITIGHRLHTDKIQRGPHSC